MLRAGLDLDGKLLALAAASHSGEDFHVAGVREILARAGLTEGALRCPPALPLDEQTQREVLRRGGGPDRVHMNCSGKHAAMLATAWRPAGRPASYLDPGAPAAGRDPPARWRSWPASQSTAVGVDGCGAPLFALSLTGLARALRVAGHRAGRHPGAPGGRRDAGPPGLDLGQPPPGTGADGRGPRPAGQVRGGGRGGARAGRRPGRRVQDRGRRVPGPPRGHRGRAAPARRGQRARRGPARRWTRSRMSRCLAGSRRSAWSGPRSRADGRATGAAAVAGTGVRA